MRKTMTRVAAPILAASLALSMLTIPATAHADALDDATSQVEETTNAYNEAKAAYDAVVAEIEATSAQVAELEAVLPGYEKMASSAAVSLYKAHKNEMFLIEAFLAMDDMGTVLRTANTLEKIYTDNLDAIAKAFASKNELAEKSAKLEEDRVAAEAALNEANSALEAAKSARNAAQRAAYGGGGAATSGAQSDGLSPIDWNMSEADFVAMWAPRIDGYLSGSPMAGLGNCYATMSYRYGVDPRWSPAISMIESGRGSACFAPHNAWGMIAAGGFPSWEAGIEASCKLLGSKMYGGVHSMRAAQLYCNSGWYAPVLAQMKRI